MVDFNQLFYRLVDLFEHDPEDEQVDWLVKEFAQEVKSFMRDGQTTFVPLKYLDYDEVLRYEGVHYLLHFYGLRLKLITISRKLTLLVEPLPEEAPEYYQGLVIQRRIINNPWNS